MSMFLGFFAWYRGLAIGPMTTVSQIQLVQPVLSVLWSVAILGRTPHARIGSGRVCDHRGCHGGRAEQAAGGYWIGESGGATEWRGACSIDATPRIALSGPRTSSVTVPEMTDGRVDRGDVHPAARTDATPRRAPRGGRRRR